MSELFSWPFWLAWTVYALAGLLLLRWGVRPLCELAPPVLRPSLRVIGGVVLLSPTLVVQGNAVGISPALLVLVQGVWAGSALVIGQVLMTWMLVGAVALAVAAWWPASARPQTREQPASSAAPRPRVEPRL